MAWCDVVWHSMAQHGPDLVRLRPGPLLQPPEDALVALHDPVLLDIELLQLGGGDGHAKAHLQHAAAWG